MSNGDDGGDRRDEPRRTSEFERYLRADPIELLRRKLALLRGRAEALFGGRSRLDEGEGRRVRLPSPGTPPPQPEEEEPEEPIAEPGLSFIGFRLVDPNGRAIGGEPYKLVLPDGSTREEKLDDQGYVREDPTERGVARISFPRIHIHPRYRDE